MNSIFLTTKTLNFLQLRYNVTKDDKMFAKIDLETIQSHIDNNPYTSEFLDFKEKIYEAKACFVIKDVYWKSGKNYEITFDEPEIAMVEPTNANATSEPSKPIFLKEIPIIIEKSWIAPTRHDKTMLKTEEFKLTKMLLHKNHIEKKFIEVKEKVFIDKGSQVAATHYLNRKLQYSTKHLESSQIKEICARDNFLSFVKEAEQLITKDIEFEELLFKSAIKSSDIFISNKDKLTDLTSFSLNEESGGESIFATCILFVPEQCDKTICSFGNIKVDCESIVLCKWYSKDIIAPEKVYRDKFGITTFSIYQGKTIVAGFQDGSIKFIDLETFDCVSAKKEVKATQNRAPIGFILIEGDELIAISTKFEISKYLMKDSALELISNVFLCNLVYIQNIFAVPPCRSY
eukprot:NODE_46_length_32145_cov_0.918711.p10 type:complete len:403 gc:universal NODE_46_length_32145_cov_0.918711:12377-13585(+)